MEKLQKALQKARSMRDGAVPADHAAPAAALAPSQSRPGASAPTAAPAPAATAAAAAAEPGPLVLDHPLPAGSEADLAWAALTPLDVAPDHFTRHRVFTLNPGPSATPFDILRTKIQLLMRKNNWTRIAITSPTAACGKTTTACNLAVGLSRQPGFRTVLIELDLHRPAMARTLGFTPKADVTSMLLGTAPFAEQAVRLRENVAVSAARRTSGDPTAVLLNRRTHETLTEIERIYAPDMMIFDLPPLLTSDDTRAFLNDVDCALMVVRAEMSTVSQIDTCEREIAEHTNPLGLVLNQCRHAGQDYQYGYGYGTGQSEDLPPAKA